jgi:hypothetical protein
VASRMITNITFLAIGGIILISAILRSRYYTIAKQTIEFFQSNPDVPDEYTEDDVSYQGSFSQKWVVENLSRRKYGRFYRLVNDVLLDNTLYGFFFLALLLIFIPLLIWSAILRSPAEYWTSIGSGVFALMIIIGTGGPKVSEELLQAIDEAGTQKLSKGDYPFIVIARNQIIISVTVKIFFAACFLLLVPFAENMPIAFGGFGTFIAESFLWFPFTYLAPISIVLAFVFLAAEITLIIVIIGKSMSILFGRVSPPIIFHVEDLYPHRTF